MLDLVESKLSQHEAFRADVLAGLAQRQKSLPSRWLYDQRGSELFEEITGLDEYYLTRIETAIQVAHQIREADRVHVEDGGRVGVGSHLRRIARQTQNILDAD